MPLQIDISLHYRKDALQSYDDQTIALLTFDTLAPVTHDRARSKSFGRWSSEHKLIGVHRTGKYYVANIHVSEEENWALNGPMHGEGDTNPVAFFFDERWEDPFMVLYRLAPMQLDSSTQTDPKSKSNYWSKGFLRGFEGGYYWVDSHVSWRPKQ